MTQADTIEKPKKKPGPKKGTQPSRNAVHERQRQERGEYRSYRERVERGGPDYRLRYRIGKRTSLAVVGLEDYSQWEDEELERGYRRAKDGTFKGRPPKVIPMELYQEMRRRTQAKANLYMAKHAEDVAKALIDIIKDKDMDEKARVAAIKEYNDREYGKPGQQIDVSVSVEKPWEKLLKGSVVEIGSAADGEGETMRPALSTGEEDIVDAEVVEEEDYEEPDPDDYDPEIDWDEEEAS